MSTTEPSSPDSSPTDQPVRGMRIFHDAEQTTTRSCSFVCASPLSHIRQSTIKPRRDQMLNTTHIAEQVNHAAGRPAIASSRSSHCPRSASPQHAVTTSQLTAPPPRAPRPWGRARRRATRPGSLIRRWTSTFRRCSIPHRAMKRRISSLGAHPTDPWRCACFARSSSTHPAPLRPAQYLPTTCSTCSRRQITAATSSTDWTPRWAGTRRRC